MSIFVANRRLGSSAQIGSRSVADNFDHAVISAIVRAQPMHHPVSGSMRQVLMHGLFGRSGWMGMFMLMP